MLTVVSCAVAAAMVVTRLRLLLFPGQEQFYMVPEQILGTDCQSNSSGERRRMNNYNSFQQPCSFGLQWAATAFVASAFRYEAEQKRQAQKEEEKSEKRRKNREAGRRFRLRQKLKEESHRPSNNSDGIAVEHRPPSSASPNASDTAVTVSNTSASCASSSAASTRSPPAAKSDDVPATSSKKRKLSADNTTAALITPYKPQEDALDTDHAESNDNIFADDDDDDNDDGMHCFDDGDTNIEEEDVTSKPAASPDQSGEGKRCEEEDMGVTKPASSLSLKTSIPKDQSDEGKVGLVLIPLMNATDIPLFLKGTQYVYWPALIYSSYEEFESTFTINKDTRQVYTEIVREWPRHESNVIALWKHQGIIPPIEQYSYKPQPIQMAVLFGSDIPPSGTRSYPICPKDVTVVRGGVPHDSQTSFTSAKVNRLREIAGYANNSKFLEAVDMAKKYKFSRDTKIFASLKLR